MEIIGRLTRDAELRSLPDGRQVLRFTLAVNDSYKSKDRETLVKKACFFDCSYWRHFSLAPYLTKGSLVEVQGQLSVRAWTNAEGQAKANLQVHVNSVKLHGKTNPATQPAPADNPTEPGKTRFQPMEDLPF